MAWKNQLAGSKKLIAQMVGQHPDGHLFKTLTPEGDSLCLNAKLIMEKRMETPEFQKNWRRKRLSLSLATWFWRRTGPGTVPGIASDHELFCNFGVYDKFPMRNNAFN